MTDAEFLLLSRRLDELERDAARTRHPGVVRPAEVCYCGQEIFRMPSSRSLACSLRCLCRMEIEIDAAPTRAGNIALEGGVAVHLSPAQAAAYPGPLYLSHFHFASCARKRLAAAKARSHR